MQVQAPKVSPRPAAVNQDGFIVNVAGHNSASERRGSLGSVSSGVSGMGTQSSGLGDGADLSDLVLRTGALGGALGEPLGPRRDVIRAVPINSLLKKQPVQPDSPAVVCLDSTCEELIRE